MEVVQLCAALHDPQPAAVGWRNSAKVNRSSEDIESLAYHG